MAFLYRFIMQGLFAKFIFGRTEENITDVFQNSHETLVTQGLFMGQFLQN